MLKPEGWNEKLCRRRSEESGPRKTRAGRLGVKQMREERIGRQ